MKFLLSLLLCTFLVACSQFEGPRGSVGAPGEPAKSCTVSQVPSGVLITCPDGSATLVEAPTCPAITPTPTPVPGAIHHCHKKKGVTKCYTEVN